jgi:chromosome segregation ATPase
MHDDAAEGVKMNATELFKGAEEVGKFVRTLKGLAELEPILRDAGSLMQAAEEAKQAHATATDARDAALLAAAKANDAVAAAEVQAAETIEAARAKHDDIITAAEAVADGVRTKANDEAIATVTKAADEVAQAEAKLVDLAAQRSVLAGEVEELTAKRDAVQAELAALAKRLG